MSTRAVVVPHWCVLLPVYVYVHVPLWLVDGTRCTMVLEYVRTMVRTIMVHVYVLHIYVMEYVYEYSSTIGTNGTMALRNRRISEKRQ
jgi:hypothetical protein